MYVMDSFEERLVNGEWVSWSAGYSQFRRYHDATLLTWLAGVGYGPGIIPVSVSRGLPQDNKLQYPESFSEKYETFTYFSLRELLNLPWRDSFVAHLPVCETALPYSTYKTYQRYVNKNSLYGLQKAMVLASQDARYADLDMCASETEIVAAEAVGDDLSRCVVVVPVPNCPAYNFPSFLWDLLQHKEMRASEQVRLIFAIKQV